MRETPVPTTDDSSEVNTLGAVVAVANVVQSRGKKSKVLRLKNRHAATFLVINTEELSEKQKSVVGKMLEKEAESFSKTDDNVGRAEELQVDINLTDQNQRRKDIA